jgi:hypothetical protein
LSDVLRAYQHLCGYVIDVKHSALLGFLLLGSRRLDDSCFDGRDAGIRRLRKSINSGYKSTRVMTMRAMAVVELKKGAIRGAKVLRIE